MNVLKRLFGKLIEKTDEGIVIKTRRKTPVFVPFSELARIDVSVIIWKDSSNDEWLPVGCTVDVMWWDSTVDYSALFGKSTNVQDEPVVNYLEEPLPF